MTRRRVYIQKDGRDPIFDLWIELKDSTESDPYINLCYNGEQGKEIIVSLSMATSERLINGLKELTEKCYQTIEDYVVENDQVSDN